LSTLLDTAIAAHGGIERWNALRSVSVELSVAGLLWDLKRQTGLFADSTYIADTPVKAATLGRFGAGDRQVRFTPDRLILETLSGDIIEVRDNPRGAFSGHDMSTPWDRLHAAYFDGNSLWTDLTQPFLYTYPGFEVEPWQEQDEIWRRLKVSFPEEIATHSREQVTYFGPDGLMRRRDYAVDVLGGAVAAQYIGAYHGPASATGSFARCRQ
jgi:hypothetical protein